MISYKSAHFNFELHLLSSFYTIDFIKGNILDQNGKTEFLDEAGIFSLEDYVDCSVFGVSRNEDRTLTPHSVPVIETPPMATPAAS